MHARWGILTPTPQDASAVGHPSPPPPKMHARWGITHPHPPPSPLEGEGAGSRDGGEPLELALHNAARIHAGTIHRAAPVCIAMAAGPALSGVEPCADGAWRQ